MWGLATVRETPEIDAHQPGRQAGRLVWKSAGRERSRKDRPCLAAAAAAAADAAAALFR